MRMKRTIACIGIMLAGLVAPAAAEVRFGNNVFIGGHDFSHQSFGPRHRAVVTLYDHPIRGAGCVTRADGRGGTVKRCRLQTIRHR